MKEIESTWYKKIFWKITSSNFHLVCSVHRFCGYDSFKIKSWSLTWCFRETYSSLIWLNFEKKKDKNCKTSKSYNYLFKDSLCWVYSQRICYLLYTIINEKKLMCVGLWGNSSHNSRVQFCLFDNKEKTWCILHGQ